MLPVFLEYMKEIAPLHKAMIQVIEGLPDEALDWVPGPQMNSINVLVAHTTGAEKFLIGDLLGDITSHRNRDAEFQAKGLSKAALKEMVATAQDTVYTVLEKLTHADLENPITTTKQGRTYNVPWALNHNLAHVALHLAHMEMTRQLWEQRQ